MGKQKKIMAAGAEREASNRQGLLAMTDAAAAATTVKGRDVGSR